MNLIKKNAVCQFVPRQGWNRQFTELEGQVNHDIDEFFNATLNLHELQYTTFRSLENTS